MTIDPSVFKAYDVRGIHPDELDEDAQWRKLEEMVKAAETVWGGVPAVS